MSLRQNILNFARPKRGHRVGDGQCWTFVETALRTAGAKTTLYLRDGSFGGRSVTVTGQMWFYRALPK